jgi:site-specific DNA recombinase
MAMTRYSDRKSGFKGGDVAVYARYSSHLQSQASIDDQIYQCVRRANELGFSIREENIFADPETTGSLRDRPGLEALQNKISQKLIKVVLIDDLSRLSRLVSHIVPLVEEWQISGVRIISLSDGYDSDIRGADFLLHLKASVNQHYLALLAENTKRGQMGLINKKLVFWNCYGYELSPSRRHFHGDGRPYTDSIINKDQAEIVLRIYKAYAEGQSINAIVRRLNKDNIATKKGLAGGWNFSTVRRILSNKLYSGIAVWGATKNLLNLRTGRRHQIKAPEEIQNVFQRPDLRIIPEDLEAKVKSRLQETRKIFPKFGERIGRTKSYPTRSRLLSGNISCGICKNAIVAISGKGGG